MRKEQRQISCRDPSEVMRLSRLGSLHQSRLSFMRILTRRMAQENWQFTQSIFKINDVGVGYAVYTVTGPERSYSLIAFAHDLPAQLRSDRVIAQAWDATFTLYDGLPSQSDIERLLQNVPLQEVGRISEKELILSRANKSVRLWEHVVSALADGKQPEIAQIDKVGYLMRTTAVYGSGKFGAADRESIADRDEFQAPFQVEMLSIYLMRIFVRDLIHHIAKTKGKNRACELDPLIARRLGIGNSTGLGMAPFIVNRLILFNNWIMAREKAIARVRSVMSASSQEVADFLTLQNASEISVARWQSDSIVQIDKLKNLNNDLLKLAEYSNSNNLYHDYPWDRLINWTEQNLSLEGQELVASLILEPYGHLIDKLSVEMADSNMKAFTIEGSMTIQELRSIIANCFGWAIDIDWTKKHNCARIWYISQEKLEPRLGQRFEEPLERYEQPLSPARDGALAYRELEKWDDKTTVAEFLLRHPEHRHTVRRAQINRIAPYCEINDNTICDTLLPIDMLRAKLSFFGATNFDPRSDRWMRICMYTGAPYPEELTPETGDRWVYPKKTA